MKKYKNKIIAAIVAIALVAGLAGGGVYWKSHAAKKEVNVYSVSELSTTYWGDENTSYGPVDADRTQSVFLSDTQTVKDVLVSEGDEVKKGDVLMTYDTTLSEVEVAKKDLEIQQMELDLQKAKENLAKIYTYKPGVSVPEKNQIDDDDDLFDSLMGSGTDPSAVLAISGWTTAGSALLSAVLPMVMGSASAEESSTEVKEESSVVSSSAEESTTEKSQAEESSSEKSSTEEATTEKTSSEESTTEKSGTEESTTEKSGEESSSEVKESTSAADESSSETESSAAEETKGPELQGGRGTEKKPYLYYWTENKTFDQGMMEYLANGRKNAYVKIQLDPSKQTEDEGETSWTMLIHRSKDTFTFEMIALCVNDMEIELAPEETEEESTEDNGGGYDDPYYWGGGGDSGLTYTASEIAELLQDYTEKVRDLDLEIRTAKVEYEKLKKELDNSSIVSEIDGVVRTLRDQDEAKINGEAVIDISGGGGYYVTGQIGELDLDTIQIGQTISVMSWDTYMSYDGTITEISDYPLEENYYWSGSGNSNVSYYQFTAFIDEDAELQDGEYVEISFTASEGENNHFYLMSSMIRDEGGSSYVYVENEAGTIEKRTIITGKTLWGYYTEIRSGLTMEEYVAFPYGSDLKEGAPAVESSTDALYNY